MTTETQGDETNADKIRAGLKANTEAENVDTGAETDGEDNADTTTPPAREEKPKPTDKEAALLKDVMKHKAAAKKNADDLKALQDSMAGIDLDEVRKLLEQRETDENAALEKKGEYDRLLAKQREAADAKVAAEKKRADDAEAEKSKLLKSIEDLTTGQAFSNSKFVAEKLVLTPNKAKALYKGHFEFVEGKMVAYDKPAGEADRTPIVNEAGETVSFEAAIEAIINADPDKDYLLKTEQKSGAGSKPKAGTVVKPTEYADNADKIAAGLDALLKKK